MYRHFYGPGPQPLAPDGGHWVMGILFILFWLLVIFLAVSILARHRPHYFGLHQDHDQDPLAIAKTRYAKGEIDKAQFEQLKKDLS